MNTSEQLFLLLAEELNFTRAAERAFISQQGLSDHIRRLEKHYGTALLTRRPRVALTPAGAAVQKKLLAELYLEKDLQGRLKEIQSGAVGSICFGINSTRAQTVIPSIFKDYHARYPNVQVELVLDETNNMLRLLEQGRLDCCLGVNPILTSPQCAQRVGDEKLYLIAAASYLRQYLDFDPDRRTDRHLELCDFSGLPVAGNNSGSTTHSYLNSYLEMKGVSVKKLFASSDYNVLTQLCRTGDIAAFLPQFFLPGALSGNAVLPQERRLYALPLNEMGAPLHVSLIYNDTADPPQFIRGFRACVQEHLQRQYAKLARLEQEQRAYILP